MTEAQLQGAVTDLCELLGIAWYHTHDSRRLTDAQAQWGARLRRAGVRWAVWRPGDLLSGLIVRELREIRLGRWVTSCGG